MCSFQQNTDRIASSTAYTNGEFAQIMAMVTEAVRFFHEGPEYPTNKIIQDDTIYLYVSRAIMLDVAPSGRRVLHICKVVVTKSRRGRGLFRLFMRQLKESLRLADIVVVDCADNENLLSHMISTQ